MWTPKYLEPKLVGKFWPPKWTAPSLAPSRKQTQCVTGIGRYLNLARKSLNSAWRREARPGFARNVRTYTAMLREKAQAATTARPKVPVRRLGADCSVVASKLCNARGAKGAGHRHWRGSTGNGRNPKFNGRRQPSCGGTSRMTRECHVRFCERLGVQFPGPTRHRRISAGRCCHTSAKRQRRS